MGGQELKYGEGEVPTAARKQAPLSMDFPGKNTGIGLPFPSAGDLPYPGIDPVSPVRPALAGGFLNTSAT